MPPDEAEYQLTCSVAVACNVTLAAPQKPVSVPVGKGGIGVTIAIAGTRALGHPEFASAKKVSVTARNGVVKLFPLPNEDPPEGELNHEIGALEEAVKITVPFPQREPLDATGAGVELMVT